MKRAMSYSSEILQLMNYPSPPHFSNGLLKSKDSYEIVFAPEPRVLKLRCTTRIIGHTAISEVLLGMAHHMQVKPLRQGFKQRC